jgi:hypothetical protein
VSAKGKGIVDIHDVVAEVRSPKRYPLDPINPPARPES